MPADLTSFVGRGSDVAAVRSLVAGARLVTLTGFGGVGKTRLAYRVAGDVASDFTDGACVVDLAALDTPDLLPHAVTDALALRRSSSRDLVDILCDYLRDRRVLLVLDNCEQIAEAVAAFAERLLRAAPGVHILATSRHALRVSGEYVFPVAPLPTPHPGTVVRPGTALQYPSVALLAQRAAAVVPGFVLEPEHEASAVALCQRLDGIPLAIELAAVRLRVLTIDELVARLDDQLAMLGDGNRDHPERHRTLESLIDWSHDLCTAAEKRLWARASVFAGGCTLDALEAVCSDDTLPRSAILDTLAHLVDKSILVREVHGPVIRFRMLETLRSYGAARLVAAGEQASFDRRHRDWCLEVMDEAGAEWVGPGQQRWADRLVLEMPNLRRALAFCEANPDEARAGMRLAAVPWFWATVGSLGEAALWLRRFLALDDSPSRERAWALATFAYIAAFHGDEEVLATAPDEAYSVASQINDPATLAYAMHVRGTAWVVEGPGRAIPLLNDALEQYADTDVPAQYPDSLRIELAAAHILNGDNDGASRVLDDVFATCATNGDGWNLSYALWGRGYLRLLDGRLDEAQADLRESLAIKRPLRDTLGLAFALETLAWTDVAKGDHIRAAMLMGGADALWEGAGARQVLPSRQDFEAIAREAVGQEAFDAAVARGHALSTDESVEFALGHDRAISARPGRDRAEGEEQTGAAKSAGLTRRQQEVAELVAAGFSNRDIAARLVISVRTAEGHVESVLNKLNFTTRTQIAGWVLQQSGTAASDSPGRG
ncbi:LuxR family transcriptional regulator [Jatrophihabitans fulvus]